MPSGLPPDFHKQCQECHAIINGPATGQNPGHFVEHIAADGSLMRERSDSEHVFNVSHGVCEDCRPAFEAHYRGWIERRKAERAAEQAGTEPEV